MTMFFGYIRGQRIVNTSWHLDLVAHGMRNEFALGSRTGVRGSFMALTFASGSRAVPHSTAYDVFMALSMALS